MLLSLQYFWYVSLVLIFFSLLANAHSCTEGFILEAKRINITQNCKLNALGAEFAWNFDNSTRRLDVAFGARLQSDTAWLAWGLNPQGPRMAGTRALIGIKHQNGIESHMYNVTGATKRHCQLLPTDDIGLNVTNFSFFYEHAIKYYMIKATIVDLPPDYNASSANVVWEIGEAAGGGQPFMHPTSLDHLDTTQTIDLFSGEVLSYKPSQRRRMRTAHGVLNIVGWGIFLPSGAIVMRYFKSYPKKVKWSSAVHIGFQGMGYILGSTGWGIGLWLGQESEHYTFTTHRILAIMIFTFTTIQMMALRLKPKGADEYRTFWNMYHHFLGYSLLGVIAANIFQGINIIESDHHHSWRWSYVGVLAALGAVALVLELYTWLKFTKRWDKFIACVCPPKNNQTNPSTSTAPLDKNQTNPSTSTAPLDKK
ncbi:hypothetical protein C2S51_009842 [Perilla frutescens var. frutescens]|nr:hypothetical protein C2S51_009842 [Perilla frutescens var. frutescens]